MQHYIISLEKENLGTIKGKNEKEEKDKKRKRERERERYCKSEHREIKKKIKKKIYSNSIIQNPFFA